MANKTKQNLSPRQASILAAIVKEYSENPEPVGSKELNGKYRFNISAATIRNEMAALEKLGFIAQPHTSAGRVPTDAGYRYFVNELMKRIQLSMREQKLLQEQLLHLQKQHQEISKNIAKLLAEKSDQAAFALLPDQASATGLSNILAQPNINKDQLSEVVNFFERIDEYGREMMTKFPDDQPEAIIGSEQLPEIHNYSMIVSRVSLPSGESGLIGIIGPKAMRYDKNITLIEYVAKLLSGGLLVVLLTHFKY